MPSAQPIPTVTELLDAFRASVHGTKDPTADLHRGSGYDVLAGVGALLFVREATRDRDIFRAVYFDYAEGDDLDVILESRRHNPRIKATPGTGHVSLHRPSAAAAGGTFWRGTRIAVLSAGMDTPKIFTVSEDTPAGAPSVTAHVPIESDIVGNLQAIDTVVNGAAYMRIDDPLWDSSWIVDSVVCSPGAARETDQSARARVRRERVDARIGYAKAITDACLAQGASTVALFASNFFGRNPADPDTDIIGELDSEGFGDVGLNRVIIGDAGFNADTGLIRRCTFAMDSVAVFGTSPIVMPMAPVAATVNVTVHLWNDPGQFDAASIAREARLGIENYFLTRKNAFAFKRDAMVGAILRSVRDVQSVVFGSASTPEPILTEIFNTQPVARYGTSDATVQVTVAGPE